LVGFEDSRPSLLLNLGNSEALGTGLDDTTQYVMLAIEV
jgi:hypothetical protein